MHRVNGASPGEMFPDPSTAAQPVISLGEPPVVGLASETTDERKTDTMKPYILRTAKPVERQKSIRPPRPKPAAPVALKGPVLFIGLDVQKNSGAPTAGCVHAGKNVTAGGWAAMATGEKPGSSTADGSAGGPPGGTVDDCGGLQRGTGPKAKGRRDDFSDFDGPAP